MGTFQVGRDPHPRWLWSIGVNPRDDLRFQLFWVNCAADEATVILDWGQKMNFKLTIIKPE